MKKTMLPEIQKDLLLQLNRRYDALYMLLLSATEGRELEPWELELAKADVLTVLDLMLPNDDNDDDDDGDYGDEEM